MRVAAICTLERRSLLCLDIGFGVRCKSCSGKGAPLLRQKNSSPVAREEKKREESKEKRGNTGNWQFPLAVVVKYGRGAWPSTPEEGDKKRGVAPVAATSSAKTVSDSQMKEAVFLPLRENLCYTST